LEFLVADLLLAPADRHAKRQRQPVPK